jgi:hypothetical protein
MPDIDVTKATASEFKAVRDSLQVNLQWLAEAAKEFPVEYVFGGMRFVFESREEIEETIKFLNEQIELAS